MSLLESHVACATELLLRLHVLNLLNVLKLVLCHYLWVKHLGRVTYIADCFTCDH